MIYFMGYVSNVCTLVSLLREQALLTLASVTSERARQVWGGLREPPPAILALEQNFAQKSCFPKGWHQLKLIWPLFGNFFQKSPKKLVKI